MAEKATKEAAENSLAIARQMIAVSFFHLLIDAIKELAAEA